MDKQMQGHGSVKHAQMTGRGWTGTPSARAGNNIAAPRPKHDEELQRWTFTWMATLPKHLRPIRLGSRFARIANRLAAVWTDEKTTSRYLDSLLLDQRGDRKGFPESVAAELRQLDGFNKSRRNDDESAWDFVRESLSPRS